MAQGGNQLNRERFCCSICLDLLKDPVTVLCGHSFCMNCIKSHWDGEEDGKMVYSCPLCRETFRPRPRLMKNTMLAELVEELMKPEVHAADLCYAGAEDVACDVCTGRKCKALKSCLDCLASYCEEHLQPHHHSPAFKKHTLVEPSKTLQENICPRHNKVMDMFCRTDQQCICYLCSVEEHEDHDTVSAAAERTQKQSELEMSLQRLQGSKSFEHWLTKEERTIDHAANKAVKDSEEIINGLIKLLQKRKSEVRQQIRFQQKTEVSRVRVLQMKLKQEITVLKWREAELKPLLNSEDHTQFLLTYLSVPALGPSTASSTIDVQPRRYFEDVMASVAKVRDQIQHVLTETQNVVPRPETSVTVSPSQPLPETREEFLRCSQALMLDPNSANTCLVLSEGNRTVAAVWEAQPYRCHPHRFTHLCQVLSRESVTGRCYWEVKWKGRGLRVALTYKTISRSGRSSECMFGNNNNSWALDCSNNGCDYYHKGVQTKVSSGLSCKIGVYLDHSAGLLCFYRVSDTMTLLHRVHTTFSQPLHAAVRLNFPGTIAEFC